MGAVFRYDGTPSSREVLHIEYASTVTLASHVELSVG
jgi:hypothetical protein